MIITNNRSLSRLAAVQTLFQYDFNERMQLHDFKNLNDKEISEIVQIVSYFNYINRVADGLGLEPETFIDKKGYEIN